MNDRDVAVTNTFEDKNLITTVITKNPEVQYGLDGIVFNEAGDLFVGNFGDVPFIALRWMRKVKW